MDFAANFRVNREAASKTAAVELLFWSLEASFFRCPEDFSLYVFRCFGQAPELPEELEVVSLFETTGDGLSVASSIVGIFWTPFNILGYFNFQYFVLVVHWRG